MLVGSAGLERQIMSDAEPETPFTTYAYLKDLAVHITL